MSDIPVIAFGPNPETFYIGVGMRYYAPNTPASMQATIKKWPAIQIKWLSMDADGQGWVARDAYSSRVEYSTIIPQDVIDKLNGLQRPDYLTFGPSKSNFCTVAPGGAWSGDMEDKMIEQLREIQTSVGGVEVFDRALEGILFGKGTTMIFLFKGAFSYYTDSEAEGSSLEKVLDEYVFREPRWTIERGSCLSFYNVDYFFLKFKDPQSSTIKMHWSLPQDMMDKLTDLRAQNATPEAKLAIQNHEQLQLYLATSNFGLAMAAGNAVRNVTSGTYTYWN